MDCCGNIKQKTKYEDETESVKGGNSMGIKKNTMLWIAVGVLLIATIFLTVKASSIGTGAAQATASAARTAVSSASSGMVGGC